MPLCHTSRFGLSDTTEGTIDVATMPDGARRALLGYLYQLLNTAALRAVPSGVDGYPASLLADVRLGQLVLEVHGQDAAIRIDRTGPAELVALQFKHLGEPGSTLGFQDLIEILHALEMSRRAAAAVNETINRSFLVTNRTLDPRAKRLWAKRNGSRRPDELQLIKNTASTLAAWKESILSAYATPKAGAATATTAKTAATAWWAVLKGLVLFENFTFDRGLVDLRDYAAAFGVLEAEQEERLNQLAGLLFRTTAAGPVQLSRQVMNGCLVGSERGACLRFRGPHVPHIAERCNASLDSHIVRVAGSPGGNLARRSVQEAIRAAASQHSVVFVHGPGGVGKSTEALCYLRSVTATQVAIHLPADEASEAAIGREFHRLRTESATTLAAHPIDDAIARIGAANRSVRRGLTVGLDGADEVETRSAPLSAIRGLINRCWASGDPSRSGFTLIVSCRSRPGSYGTGEADLINRWLNSAHPDALLPTLGFVPVGDFEPEELLEAARQRGTGAEARLAEWLEPGRTRSRIVPQGMNISDFVVHALLHPVVWGAYLDLVEDIRNRALDGDPGGLDALAQRFLAIFFRKCQSRGATPPEGVMRAALEAVAAGSPAPPLTRLDGWVSRCTGGGCLNDREANFLFNEANDYGLIALESATEWRWRHGFVRDYLARGTV